MIFASTIVIRALAYPLSMAAFGDFPSLASSRILSKIRTLASTAMPIVSTIPAIPGSVRVALKAARAPMIIMIFIMRARFAMKPDRL